MTEGFKAGQLRKRLRTSKTTRRNLLRRRLIGFQSLEPRQLLAADGPQLPDSDTGGNGGGKGPVSGELIVSFRPAATVAQVNGVYQANGANEVETLYGSPRVKRITVPEAARDQVMEALSKHPLVEYVEPNYRAARTSVPNDPYYSLQWNLDNTQFGGIHAEAAWSVTTGTGAVIAVLDTGIAYENYSDSLGNYYASPDLNETNFLPGYDFVNNDSHANDDQGHGTHVAGTIAQSTNNASGVAGVAYGATLMPVKVLGADGSGTYSGIANGIRWAADQGAHVLNLSLGGGSASTTLQNALAYAHGKGVTIIAAAGNDGLNQVSYPAAYDNYVIAVSATRYDEQIAPYSNYGTSIDIAAPGGDVSVDQNGDGYADGILQSTFSGTTDALGYYFFQGTSMAAPHVAGAAGLIVSLGITNPEDVRQLLTSTAEDKGDLGVDEKYGHGILDAGAAVAAAAAFNNDPIAGDDSLTTDEDVNLTVDALANDSDPDGDTLAISSMVQPTHGSATANNDGTITYTPDQNYFGNDSLTYTLSDGNGGTDTGTVFINVVAVNDPPEVNGDTLGVAKNETAGIYPLQNDLDIDSSTLNIIDFTTPANGSVTLQLDQQFIYSPNENFVGSDQFQYTISDGDGGSSSGWVDVTVTEINRAPVALDDSIETTEDHSATFSVLLNDTDPDGDTLLVTDIGAPLHGSVILNTDGTLSYTPKADYHGSDSFLYTVSDGRGGSDSANVSVQINSVIDVQVQPVQSDLDEGDSGTTPYLFEIGTDEQSQEVINFEWRVISNDTDSDDFLGGIPTGTVSLAAGEITAPITFEVLGDLNYEPDERFEVQVVSSSSTADLTKAAAGGNIRNDDPAPIFSYTDLASAGFLVHGSVVGDVSNVAERDGIIQSIQEEAYQKNRRTRSEYRWEFVVSGGDLGVEFHLNAGHSSEVESFNFEYDTGDGTGWRTLINAISPEMKDYTITLPDGFSGPVVVRAIDTNRRQNESSIDSLKVDRMVFESQRSTPLPPRVSVETPDGYSSESGQESGWWRIKLDQPASHDLTLRYELTGTASTTDFLESHSGVVTILAGESAAVLKITPVDDQLEEGTETVRLNLTEHETYEILGDGSGLIYIADDDVVINHFFPTAEQTITGSMIQGSMDELTHLDDVHQTLREASTNGKPTSRTSAIEHQWSFDVEQALSFHVTAKRPSNTEGDNFHFQYSLDQGSAWFDLLTIASKDSFSNSAQLPSAITGGLLLRVIDSDPITAGNGSEDSILIDQLYFSTDTATATGNGTAVWSDSDHKVGGALEITETETGEILVVGPNGKKLTSRGKQIRARVARGQQFIGGKTWRTDRVEIRGGQPVQIATNGDYTLLVEGDIWRNFVKPSDVNNDNSVTSLDALAIVNEVVGRRFSEFETGEFRDPSLILSVGAGFFDQNGDGICSAFDALRIINELSRSPSGPDGEMVPSSTHQGQSEVNVIAVTETGIYAPLDKLVQRLAIDIAQLTIPRTAESRADSLNMTDRNDPTPIRTQLHDNYFSKLSSNLSLQ